jgi:hypothetical protein
MGNCNSTLSTEGGGAARTPTSDPVLVVPSGVVIDGAVPRKSELPPAVRVEVVSSPAAPAAVVGEPEKPTLVQSPSSLSLGDSADPTFRRPRRYSYLTTPSASLADMAGLVGSNSVEKLDQVHPPRPTRIIKASEHMGDFVEVAAPVVDRAISCLAPLAYVVAPTGDGLVVITELVECIKRIAIDDAACMEVRKRAVALSEIAAGTFLIPT